MDGLFSVKLLAVAKSGSLRVTPKEPKPMEPVISVACNADANKAAISGAAVISLSRNIVFI